MGKTLLESIADKGLYTVVEPNTDRAFKIAEERIWREQLDDSPHGDPWHTSFHASSFPGNSERACGRKAIYTLSDFPSVSPAPRRLRGQGEVGKAVELMLVRAFGLAGILLSNDQTAGDSFQTNFVDEDLWLTGACDAIILPYRWNRPHVVEIKTKAHDVIRQMKEEGRGPDEKHTYQVRTYIGFAHEQAYRWPELQPCQSGSIFYLSRDDPSYTHEFYFSYDPDFMDAGRNQLRDWQEHFLRDKLPSHPFNGKEWSKEPCLYCPFKKNICKRDWESGITKISESNGIREANKVREGYDYESKRTTVLNRWNADDLADRS